MISFTNVRLIFAREVRDQLRDRRTLFMIFVLPLLLYPLLGTAYLRMVQFRTEKPLSILVVGSFKKQADEPRLFEDGAFAPELFHERDKGPKTLHLEFVDNEGSPAIGDAATSSPALAVDGVQTHRYDAALCFPADFEKKLADYRKSICQRAASHGSAQPPAAAVTIDIPRPQIVHTTANERSQMASERLMSVLDRWTEEVGQNNLAAVGVPASAVRPFDSQNVDLSENTSLQGAGVWSRMLPVLLLLWALTGAFYPAIDLCAGEKERGTLETLLSSPAQRTEIVLGKLMTIMLVSMTTSALNLISVSATGCMVLRLAGNVGSPPAWAMVWLPLALVPMSALFSALCLALAAFARSTREGQYYLMPLLLIMMPLAMLPMSGGVELNFGNALLPVAGVALLLKSLLEGSYFQALQYLPIVLAVTGISCALSVRWAVEQFTSESVLFREGERFQPGLWLRHLMRDRQSLPSPAEATVCGIVILLLMFVLSSSAATPPGFNGFIRVILVTQLAVILTPALLMSVVLTSSPRKTLLLRLPRLSHLAVGVILAVALHPFLIAFAAMVDQLYPISPEVLTMLKGLTDLFQSAPKWQLVLVVAAVPAVCEELAFRGFILSGFRSTGNKTRAIVLSALFFGLSHAFLQQSINTYVVGLVLAYLAIQSESILPGMLFHFTHNALSVTGVWDCKSPSATIFVVCGMVAGSLVAWLAQGNRNASASLAMNCTSTPAIPQPSTQGACA